MSGTLSPAADPAWINVSTSSGALLPPDLWPIICPILGIMIGIIAGLYLAWIVIPEWRRSS